MNKIIGWIVNKTKVASLVKSLYGILKALIGVINSIINLLPEDKQVALGKIVEVATKIIETVESLCASFSIDLADEQAEEIAAVPATKTAAKKNLNKYLDKLNETQGKLENLKKK